MDAPQLILASTSPRRKQLLEEAGCNFSIIPPDIRESDFHAGRTTPRKHAEKLALAKAQSVADRNPHAVVLGADTIAELDGKIIGKPIDQMHARQMVTQLFSKPHKVITGLALLCPAKSPKLVSSDVTTVYPGKLTNAQINAHIESQAWKGKAGAYAIKENPDQFIERIEGSITNVMGLPIELLHRMLYEAAIEHQDPHR